MNCPIARFLTLSSLLGAALVPLNAAAQDRDTRTYFTARIGAQEVQQQLTAAEREHYSALFRAIDRQDWATVESLLSQRPNGLLTDVARAEYYTAANSPRVELPALQEWLRTGSNLPQAAQIARLSVTRGAEREADLPYVRDTRSQPVMPRRTLPRSVNDGTMPSSIRSEILQHISNDDPDGARILLDGIDAAFSIA